MHVTLLLLASIFLITLLTKIISKSHINWVLKTFELEYLLWFWADCFIFKLFLFMHSSTYVYSQIFLLSRFLACAKLCMSKYGLLLWSCRVYMERITNWRLALQMGVWKLASNIFFMLWNPSFHVFISFFIVTWWQEMS